MYYSIALYILPIVRSLFSSLPPSWTITVHLRNPARSAVQWCPIANRFRTTPTTTIPLYPSCLLSNLAPPLLPLLPPLLYLLFCAQHTPSLSSPAQPGGPPALKTETFQIWSCVAKGSSTCWDPGCSGTRRLLF